MRKRKCCEKETLQFLIFNRRPDVGSPATSQIHDLTTVDIRQATCNDGIAVSVMQTGNRYYYRRS